MIEQKNQWYHEDEMSIQWWEIHNMEQFCAVFLFEERNCMSVFSEGEYRMETKRNWVLAF